MVCESILKNVHKSNKILVLYFKTALEDHNVTNEAFKYNYISSCTQPLA